MRKIILGVAVSLDGFIEGPKGEYDWCFMDQDYGMKAFMARIDAIFYGRKSYDLVLKEGEKAGGNPYKGMDSYVFSNTLKTVKGAKLISGNIVEQVNKIKESPGRDIWLWGGAVLTVNLMNAGLVDGIWLAVHPILLGSGKPLFVGLNNRVKTKLINSKTFNTGLVSLEYEVINP